MFYFKDSISINSEAVPIEVSWVASNLTKDIIMNALNDNQSKISQTYNEVLSKINECLDNGIDSNDCVGNYLGNEDVYTSEGGLILSLKSIINETGWIKLDYPSTVSLESSCHEGFSFLLKDTNNHFFEVFCMLEENIPDYIADIIHTAVRDNEALYIDTYSKTHTLCVPLSDINVAYSAYVEYDDQSCYSINDCMEKFGLSEDEAKDFVNYRNYFDSLKNTFV